MKINKHYFNFLVLSSSIFSFANAQVITSFGTNDFVLTEFANGSVTIIQNADSFIINSTPGQSQSLSGTVPVVDITGANQLKLEGNFSVDADFDQSSFDPSITIELLDSSSGSVAFTGGSFNDLISDGFTTLDLDPFNSDASFAFSSVSGVTINGVLFSSTISGSFNQLVATPEPSTYALLAGILALGYIKVRRSRN